MYEIIYELIYEGIGEIYPDIEPIKTCELIDELNKRVDPVNGGRGRKSKSGWIAWFISSRSLATEKERTSIKNIVKIKSIEIEAMRRLNQEN